MRNLKIVLALFSLFVVFIVLTTKSQKEQFSSKPLIVTSNFALYDVLKFIGSDKIELVSILPFGVDPHSFEPTPKTIVKLEKSALFFYSGDVLEPWTHNLLPTVSSVDISKYVVLKNLEEAHEDDLQEAKEEDLHHHGEYDPHYWLDIDNMKKVASGISEKLSELDGLNKDFFEKNRDRYIKSLEELDMRYKQKLSSCKLDTIVVTHNAFEYLADRYNFHVVSLTGLSTDAQASASDVKHIIQELKEKNIDVVFSENFANNKNMQTIANDLKIKIDTLQPLGNITANEQELGLDYKKIMESNLEKIAKAMQCN